MDSTQACVLRNTTQSTGRLSRPIHSATHRTASKELPKLRSKSELRKNAKECPKKRRQCTHRSSPFPPVINYGSNLHFYLVIRIHFLSSLSPPYQILAPAAADPEATHNGQTSAGQFDGQINSGLDRIHESEPGAVNAERARLKADAELLEFLRETAATERHSHYHNRCK